MERRQTIVLRWLLVLLVVVLLGATGCTRKSLDVSATPTTGANLDAAGVLAATSRSIALVETPLGSGSGVLIDGGYVVTNAHVLDPFGTADVAFEGGQAFTDVPVVGSDLETDIALLGPVEIDAPPLQLSPDAVPAKGDDVFLVGYPGGGETDESGRTRVDDVEVTISAGIVSRERTDDVFDHLYIQTDASIGFGQSGGALVDSTGRVVGISGLSYDETFALALSSRDTNFAVKRIQRGDAKGYPVFPTEFETTTGTLDFDLLEGFLDPTIGPGSLAFATERAETVRLTVDDPDALVAVWSLDGSLYLANETQQGADAESSFEPTETPFPEEVLETIDGAYQFDVPPESQIVIDLQPSEFGSTTIGYAIDRPVHVIRDSDPLRIITVGESLDGVVSPFEFEDSFVLNLSAGQTITVTADGAAGGDVYFTIFGPDDELDPEPVDNDTRGLLGLGESETFTATAAGAYGVAVAANDVTATYFRIEVSG